MSNKKASLLDQWIDAHVDTFLAEFVSKVDPYALQIMGLSLEEWKEIEDNDADPRYELFYSLTSSILTKILAGTIQKLMYYKEIEKTDDAVKVTNTNDEEKKDIQESPTWGPWGREGRRGN